MPDRPTAITEAARITPVGLGWASIMTADPSAQVTIVAGLLACAYMIAQLWLILLKLRSEKRRLEMAEREHERRMQAEEGRS